MTVSLYPTSGDRTRAAVQRAPGSWRAAILAMLGVFAGGGEFAPVQFFVAGYTKRNPVVNVDYQFGAFRNWLYMMGMNISANIAAILAGVIIAPVNCVSPFRKIALCLGALAKQGFAALPHRGCFAGSPFQHAFIRTDRRAAVNGVEGLAANPTGFIRRLATLRPARPRTILGIVGAVCLDFIGLAADRAGFDNLSVFHSTIITHSIPISPGYCAVAIQRWVDMTGGIPELVQ